jgi:hypothetical protein
MTTMVKTVSAVEIREVKIHIRANIPVRIVAVRIRVIVCTVIPVIIPRIDNAPAQHQGDNHEKQKFFHMAPPLRTIVLTFSAIYIKRSKPAGVDTRV